MVAWWRWDCPYWLSYVRRDNPRIRAILKAFPPRKLLGYGGFKWVYESRGLAIAITNDAQQVEEEIKHLRILRAVGLRVVKIKRWTKMGEEGVLIMTKYRSPDVFDDNLKAKCDRIGEILWKNRLYVHDLQVLLDKSGHAVLSDPLDITYWKSKEDALTFYFKVKGREFERHYDFAP